MSRDLSMIPGYTEAEEAAIEYVTARYESWWEDGVASEAVAVAAPIIVEALARAAEEQWHPGIAAWLRGFIVDYRNPDSRVDNQGEDVCRICGSRVWSRKDGSWSCDHDAATYEWVRAKKEADQ